MKPATTATPSTALEYRRRICRAMNYIGAHLDRDLTLEEIARSANFSMFHFHRVFKAVVGETVAEFTRRLRLELAANKLIMDRRGSITEVALSCGFSSSQNFARAFRQSFGTSPSAFRKNSKQGNIFSNRGNASSPLLQYSPDTLAIAPIADNHQGGDTMHAAVQEMPEYHVAYVRKMGPYGKETCEQAFAELLSWAGPRGHLASGVLLAVYWDNPEVTPADRCRTDACLSVPPGTTTEGQVALQTISGGPHAVCRFEITVDQFHQAWNEAFAWLVSGGHICDDRPCFELYHNNGLEHPEGKWIIDICIPLKRV
ncbi:MAG: AraC family transcriptional regulator [Desulfobulbaceae bacterium]|nr:MAG: AraC family transcriptional regulator [Desulfobulbaceae bacterium]